MLAVFNKFLLLIILTNPLPLKSASTENNLIDSSQFKLIPTEVIKQLPHLKKAQKHPIWLTPYTANYTIYRDGDKSGKAIRSLKLLEGKWELTSSTRAKIYFFKDKRTEKSTFSWQSKFLPLSYIYEIKNNFKKQLTQETFDWTLKTVIGSRGKDLQWNYPIENNLADPLNHQILIREQLVLREKEKIANQDRKLLQKLSFNVSSKGHPQTRNYQILGEETLTTKAGTFETVKLQRQRGKRKTIFWMAKELQFIPVKIYQEKDGDEQATMIINKFESVPKK